MPLCRQSTKNAKRALGRLVPIVRTSTPNVPFVRAVTCVLAGPPPALRTGNWNSSLPSLVEGQSEHTRKLTYFFLSSAVLFNQGWPEAWVQASHDPFSPPLGSFYFIFNAFTLSCSIPSTVIIYAPLRQDATAFHALHLVTELDPRPTVVMVYQSVPV